MKWRVRIVSWIKGRLVGCDQFGNKYYQERPSVKVGRLLFRKKGNQNLRRWVVYKGMAEPTKVPPQWHGWLHGTDEFPPLHNELSYEWQKEHLPNLTGTTHAYHPHGIEEDKKDTSKGYESWSPPAVK